MGEISFVAIFEVSLSIYSDSRAGGSLGVNILIARRSLTSLPGCVMLTLSVN